MQILNLDTLCEVNGGKIPPMTDWDFAVGHGGWHWVELGWIGSGWWQLQP
jgi:hypothetical protein